MFFNPFVFTQRMANFVSIFMSRQNTIGSSSLSRNLLIIITSVLLLFVSYAPTIQALLFSSESNAWPAGDNPSPENQKEGSDIVKISAVYEAVIPIYKIQLAFCCSFIRTFSFIEKTVRNEWFTIPPPQSGYFRILLRRIISPNAP